MLFFNMSADEKRTFLELQKHGPMTKKELSESLDIKPSTLGRILERLMANGAVLEGEYQTTAMGRKPYSYDVNTEGKYVLGIDISRVKISAVVCDIKMRVIDSVISVEDIIKYGSSAELIDKMCRDIQAMLDRNSISTSELIGAGISMVGPVDRHTGCTQRVVGFPTHDWSNMPLGDMVRMRIGCPVYVDNGTYAAVLYEYLYGVGRPYKRVAFVNSSFGIRAGYINNNVIVRSANNDESALAHTTIVPSGERCFCGKRGCVNGYATTSAIFRNIRRLKELGGNVGIDKPLNEIYFKDVIDAANAGNPSCAHEIHMAGEMFGYALSNYITLLNPELVILSGSAIHMSQNYYDTVFNAAMLGQSLSHGSTTFQKGGSHGALTMAVGGAAMYFEKYVGNPMME